MKKETYQVVGEKTCKDCGLTKPISEFYITKRGNPNSYCKKCTAIRVSLWCAKNRERYNKSHREWEKRDGNGANYKREYNKTPQRKKIIYMYGNLKQLIKNLKPCRPFLEKVGWTRKKLITRLEKTLPIGYTMADYGKQLQVDHIRPLSKFNLLDDKQFKKACRLSNIRLCSRSENSRKGRLDYVEFCKKYHKEIN